MSSEPVASLEARGISVLYGARPALRDVDLALRAGERVCLAGPNGAGKSTLVRCLTGLMTPVTGTVTLCGRPLSATSRVELARAVAVVPGSMRLPFSMTVEAVVALGRTPYL